MARRLASWRVVIWVNTCVRTETVLYELDSVFVLDGKFITTER